MKILVDHCVLQDAIRGEYVASLFPSNRQTNFHPRPERKDWKQNEIECLDKIARLCREKIFSPYITDELGAEKFRALKFPSPIYEDLFADIHFEIVQSPVDRSKWGLSLEQYMSKKDVINYCKCFFLTPSAGRIEQFISGMKANPVKSLSPFEEKCLRNATVFKAICYGIDETHYPDALHLWTAEENGMDVFLTTDKRFRNVITRQKIKLKCVILFPRELLKILEYRR